MIDFDPDKIYKKKDLCNLLNIPYDSAHSDRCLKEIERHIEILQITKQSFKIVRELNLSEKELFKSRYPSIYCRCNYDNFLINWEDRNKSGIYIIQLNNVVYIGQTKNLLNRYNNHRQNNDFNSNPKVKSILELGATFSLLCYEEDVEKRFIKESEYTKQYVENGYEVINTLEVLATREYSKDRYNPQKYATVRILRKDINSTIDILKDNNILAERVVRKNGRTNI